MSFGATAAKRAIFAGSFSKAKLLLGLKHYSLSLVLIWLAVLFYRQNQYYKSFLHPETQDALLILALAYTVGGFFFYLLLPLERLPKSKGYIIASMLRRVARDFVKYLKNFAHTPALAGPKIDQQEKVALLFVLVKIFFLPLMLNFLLDNYQALISDYHTMGPIASLFTVQGFNTVLFPLLFSLFLFVDTALFAFGYMVESKFLGSRVRSVEPTALGWIVVLICYPPFNGILNNYTSWYANDYAYFSTPNLTFVLHLAVLVLMGIFASASVALGPKASNLTNRGIVGRGPYRFVRHPAYICKNMAWWITLIPVLSLAAVLSMAVWSFVYFLRAITEERHLIRDPDYQAYCKKVRYRFIPGLA